MLSLFTYIPELVGISLGNVLSSLVEGVQWVG